MSHGNGALPLDLAWPWPRGNCKWLLDIYKHQLCCLQCKRILPRARNPDTIDRRSVDFIRTWPDIWRHNFVTWHLRSKYSGHVSNWLKRRYWKLRCDPTPFYASYSRKTMWRVVRLLPSGASFSKCLSNVRPDSDVCDSSPSKSVRTTPLSKHFRKLKGTYSPWKSWASDRNY